MVLSGHLDGDVEEGEPEDGAVHQGEGQGVTGGQEGGQSGRRRGAGGGNAQLRIICNKLGALGNRLWNS